MLKTVKTLLAVLMFSGLVSVLFMCESDARKVAKSKSLINQHAITAMSQKDAVATNKTDLLDAWGRPIIYTFGPDIVVGMSSGFDGKIGTDDDIIVIMKSKVLTKTDSNHFLNHTH